jgi:hypothetical protein
LGFSLCDIVITNIQEDFGFKWHSHLRWFGRVKATVVKKQEKWLGSFKRRRWALHKNRWRFEL